MRVLQYTFFCAFKKKCRLCHASRLPAILCQCLIEIPYILIRVTNALAPADRICRRPGADPRIAVAAGTVAQRDQHARYRHTGETPATLYMDASAPPLRSSIVSHGFAGSRQLMQAFSFHLARAGYRVLAFDALGHGRNPVPMAGDVTAIDGTTALLVAETRRVIEAREPSKAPRETSRCWGIPWPATSSSAPP